MYLCIVAWAFICIEQFTRVIVLCEMKDFSLEGLSFQNGCTMRCMVLNPVFNSPVNHWPHVAVGRPERCFTRLPPEVWSFVHETRREGVIQFKTKREKWWFFLGVLCYTSWHWQLHMVAYWVFFTHSFLSCVTGKSKAKQ